MEIRLEQQSGATLKEWAKYLGLKKTSTMNKDQLLSLLQMVGPEKIEKALIKHADELSAAGETVTAEDLIPTSPKKRGRPRKGAEEEREELFDPLKNELTKALELVGEEAEEPEEPQAAEDDSDDIVIEDTLPAAQQRQNHPVKAESVPGRNVDINKMAGHRVSVSFGRGRNGYGNYGSSYRAQNGMDRDQDSRPREQSRGSVQGNRFTPLPSYDHAVPKRPFVPAQRSPKGDESAADVRPGASERMMFGRGQEAFSEDIIISGPEEKAYFKPFFAEEERPAAEPFREERKDPDRDGEILMLDREEDFLRMPEESSTPEMILPEENLSSANGENMPLPAGSTEVSGYLEIAADGYGFLRTGCNYQPGENDAYLSQSQIRRFGLKTGDRVSGMTNGKSTPEKTPGLIRVTEINREDPEKARNRFNFDKMTPVIPFERLRLGQEGTADSLRLTDILAPIGKGQRGMIVSPPKAGKTTLIKQIAQSVTRYYPEMNLIILLIDERPEEVTDIRESIQGERVEVVYSTFDELPERHKRIAETTLSRAKGLVEQGQDVMILLDSLTRLARASNLTVTPSGRTLSGGLDPAALYMPKRFFGAARKMREGGSLTVLATALVETGSRMDEMIFEEFKGTGNMELILDRRLSEHRIFPSVDMLKSGTRRDELLLDPDEAAAAAKIRRMMSAPHPDDTAELILEQLNHTSGNAEFMNRIMNM